MEQKKIPMFLALDAGFVPFHEFYVKEKFATGVYSRVALSNSIPNSKCPYYLCEACLWLKTNACEPFTFFRSRVDCYSGEVTIEIKEDPSKIIFEMLAPIGGTMD